jgi:hypothetical protein
VATCYLVSCVSRKAASPAPAEVLYTSEWFLKARAFVLGHLRPGDQWFILSAEHGLVDPKHELAPYDTTLNRMSKAERDVWSRRVLEELRPKLCPGDDIILLAGSRYRADIVPALRANGYSVKVPMEKLLIGRQHAWLKARLTLKDPRREPNR